MPDVPLRFLVVEDNSADVRLMTHELMQAGFRPEVVCVETESEYIAHLGTHPDLILCDYNLPQFDALRALELLQERALDIPFLIVSGSIGEEIAVQAIKRGANDYLLMDRLGRLGSAVQSALDQRRFRKAERSAREELARDALLLATVRDSIVVTDLDGIVTYWNEGATRLFGWAAKEMLGRHYMDRFPEALRPIIAREMATRVIGTEWNGEVRNHHKDGTILWTHLRTVDIRDASGQRIGILRTAYDIGERKRAEEERAAAQEQRETMLLENARLLRSVAETAIQQKKFLKDVLSSVTEGRLTLCDSSSELPGPSAASPSPTESPEDDLAPAAVSLTAESLRQLRRQVEMVATACGLPMERQWDFLMAVGEASMNAVVHAGGGVGQVFGNAATGTVQVWITDHGTGIELASLPRATLERGYSTAGTLGHGFWMILQTCDRVYLLTGVLGTTVVLEQAIVPPSPAWLQPR
ncbi:MAG: PAS domain S-box protein [Fibrella sp.]|nr:PAS domain S-box protein [Armatimonadota bacterium]